MRPATTSGSPFAVFDDPLGEDFTVGVEEEFFLVDAETGDPRPDADRVLAAARAPAAGAIGGELKRSQLETGSAVSRDLSDLRASLLELRRTLSEAAADVGARLVALGTHPWSRGGEDGGVTPKAAYLELDVSYGLLATEQTVCGCHVHVGIRDDHLRIEVMNRLRGWIPTIVAMFANSPYWMGVESDYASFRTQVFHRWPTAGIPEHFADRGELDEAVAQLHTIGAIDSAARLYWDVRPSDRYPTLEIRAADVCTTVDESLALAAILRALVEQLHLDAREDRPFDAPRPEVLRAALWRASRFGLEDELVDVADLALRPASTVVDAMLAAARPVLDARGEWDTVQRTIGFIQAAGTGAERQRRSRTSDDRTGLRAVIETAATATTATVL